MKIAFKNFLTTLRRYRTASVLNIVGLTLAFTAFYIIMVQVWWEATYNRAIPDAERTYLIAPADIFDEESGLYMTNSPRPSSEQLIEQSPEIEAGGAARYWNNRMPAWLHRDGSYTKVMMPDPSNVSIGIFETLRPEIVAGDLERFTEPKTIAIARSEAERLGLHVGERISIDPDWWSAPEVRPREELEVIAIYADFPANSTFAKLKAMSDVGNKDMDSPNNWNDSYFIRLRPGTDPEEIARRWTAVNEASSKAYRERIRPEIEAEYGKEKADEWLEDDGPVGCKLIPLTELYFSRQLENGRFDKGTLSTTLSLLAVAILVIVIALINFVNFFFALVPSRLRTVNIFKVFGAPTRALRFSFLFEAVAFVCTSLLVAWYVVFTLQGTEFANYISTSLRLGDNWPVVGIEAAVALTAALVAGFYPAWYITSFNPALAAKGRFAGSRGGRRLRTALVAVQFVISMTLIIFTFFCYAQHRFVRSYDMGFDREGVLTFRAPRKAAAQYESWQAFASRLEADPAIAAVTGAQSPFVADTWSVWGRNWKDGMDIMIHIRMVRSNFLDVMRIRLLDGEGFLPEHDCDSVVRGVVMERTARQYDIHVGDVLDDIRVVGIASDLQFRPLQLETAPLLILTGYPTTTQVYLRLAPGADVEAVCDHIRAVCRETDPDSSLPDIRFMDDQIDDLYNKEERLATIVALFALMSVAISLMGVFGLVLFETQYRRREIAVRKVMGATTEEVLTMFNRRYLLIAAACFVISIPTAWWTVDRYLQQFAYRTPMSWWIFLAAFAAVAAVTVATVSVRSWTAARSNPADAVKSE